MSQSKTLQPQEAAESLAEIHLELNRLQRAIRLTIQAQLKKLAGCSMKTLEENRELAETIHRLLDSHGLRVCCTECGHPAILRVSPRGTATRGVFVFDHTIDGKRTFHGGRGSMPMVRLTAKPPRKRIASKSASSSRSGGKAPPS